jgi:hypothetical protein
VSALQAAAAAGRLRGVVWGARGVSSGACCPQPDGQSTGGPTQPRRCHPHPSPGNPQAAGAALGATACGLRDPLCSLKPRYLFGAAVIGNTAYYAGGLDANDPTYPEGDSDLEAVDVSTLAPRVLQTQPNAELNTSRYRQQLVAYGNDSLIAVGGQCDDSNGASVKTMSMIVLDLATGQWRLRRQFRQSNGGAWGAWWSGPGEQGEGGAGPPGGERQASRVPRAPARLQGGLRPARPPPARTRP